MGRIRKNLKNPSTPDVSVIKSEFLNHNIKGPHLKDSWDWTSLVSSSRDMETLLISPLNRQCVALGCLPSLCTRFLICKIRIIIVLSYLPHTVVMHIISIHACTRLATGPAHSKYCVLLLSLLIWTLPCPSNVMQSKETRVNRLARALKEHTSK